MPYPEQLEEMVKEMEIHEDGVVAFLPSREQVLSALTKAFQMGIEASEKEVKNIYGGSAHRLLQALAHLKEPKL